MSKKANSYALEFRQQIVALYNAGKSFSELTREYGVSKRTIRKWVKRASLSLIKASEKKIVTFEEYETLQKENQTLKEENEILKRATAIFAKEQYPELYDNSLVMHSV